MGKSYQRIVKLWFMAICILVMVIGLSACRRNTGAVLPERITVSAAANAIKYANATYKYKGKILHGIPYQWGGSDDLDNFYRKISEGAVPGKTTGIDCSGLVINAYRSLYPNLTFSLGSAGRTSDIDSENLYRYNTTLLPLEELRTGDLLYYSNGSKEITHVAIFLKKKDDLVSIVHATSGQGHVAVSTVNINGTWWRKSFVASGCLQLSK